LLWTDKLVQELVEVLVEVALALCCIVNQLDVFEEVGLVGLDVLVVTCFKRFEDRGDFFAWIL